MESSGNGAMGGGGPAAQAPPNTQSASRPAHPPRKRKGHRGGKKKRSRRKSFAVLDTESRDGGDDGPSQGMYQIRGGNMSGTSMDSEVLLNHRGQQPLRIRRSSTLPAQSPYLRNPFGATASTTGRVRTTQATAGRNDEHNPWDETAPLLSESNRTRETRTGPSSYGATSLGVDRKSGHSRSRRTSSRSSRNRMMGAFAGGEDGYDINHPPSVPNSPTFGASDQGDMTFGDVMIRDDFALRSENGDDDDHRTLDEGPLKRDSRPDGLRRRVSGPEDVCYPGPGMSEIGEEDLQAQSHEAHHYRTRRRRGQWPDLSVLEEWKHFEKEGRTDERRVKNITEPQLINGRLRPVRKGWYRTDEDAPYRFTYFNEEFESTIHSQTISELVQPGGDFRSLFIPDPRILTDDESEEEDDISTPQPSTRQQSANPGTGSIASTRNPSVAESRRDATQSPPPQKDSASNGNGKLDAPGAAGSVKSHHTASNNAHTAQTESHPHTKQTKYGDRPVWWLDILSPTEAEMKVISKTFGIHPLTAEDIMLEEAREKVELFRHYYFVNYRTFDQDSSSENYLEPVNMSVVVFREGVLSFHFSMTPHPANVRRRIRQLTDYLILSSDWISYAIIDDITDVFQPLIQNIEDEVDEIDDSILQLHSSDDKRMKTDSTNAVNNEDGGIHSDSSVDMLRRVGDCRKRVMSLYRLLGNKADVIKGFAKRCNERWEVAPRSEIGLYLGDIQDHIVTMTSNLSHYEKILARSHGNYLAQINIRMNERQEQTADVLGRLTVLGTIVLPMNIITGLWGMNVWVPGQEYEGDLTWFAWITVGLVAFGLACYLLAKRVYQIV